MGACQGSPCAHSAQSAETETSKEDNSEEVNSEEVVDASLREKAKCKQEDEGVINSEAGLEPGSLANELTGCSSEPSPPAKSSAAETTLASAMSPNPQEADEVPDLQLCLQDILTHLQSLEADRAWAIVKDLQERLQQDIGTVLASLEGLPECNMPLRWLEAWGPISDELFETLTSGSIPPPATPRPGEPPQHCEWSVFEMSPAEDDGIQGSIYVRYLPGLHGVEIRSELLLPGKFSDHYEGLMEVDYGASMVPVCYDSSNQWRAEIPGNFLFSLVIKPPLLPRLWWRDIILHRQVVNFEKGCYAIEYSPKCLQTSKCSKCQGCPRCTTYFKGGEWKMGMPNIKIPKVAVSGRESQFGGYCVEPATLEDGSPGVRWRNVQVAEIHLPKWAPVAKSWYVWAAAFILRRTLREFGRARAGGTFEKGFKQRAADRPSWYKEEWYKKA